MTKEVSKVLIEGSEFFSRSVIRGNYLSVGGCRQGRSGCHHEEEDENSDLGTNCGQEVVGLHAQDDLSENVYIGLTDTDTLRQVRVFWVVSGN